MDIGWKKFWLAPRQASNNPSCASSLLGAFNSDPTLLGGCAASDFNCICAQTGGDAFPSWYLNNVCNACDSQQHLNVDPISLLKEICPEQALSLQASFSCPSFTPSSSATPGQSVLTTSVVGAAASSPSITTTLQPSTTRTVNMEIPLSSSSSSSSSSTYNTTTITEIGTTLTLSSSQTTIEVAPTDTAPALVSSTAVGHHTSGGLASGAKAGIAVGVAIPAILLLLFAFFCGRRRRNMSKRSSYGDTSKAPAIYAEDGSHSAYALNPEDPAIGAAISTEGKVQLSSPPLTPEIRELYTDEEGEVEDEREIPRDMVHAEAPIASQFMTKAPTIPQSRPESSIAPHARTDSPMSPHSPKVPIPPVDQRRRGNSSGNAVELRGMTIPRKEVQSPTLGFASRPPTTQTSSPTPYDSRSDSSMSHHTRAPPPQTKNSPTSYDRSESRLAALSQIRSDSRMTSSSLRGPVPDMYAYGGETIENDEELARLEEEERMIDEAIEESERLKMLKLEREAIHKRVMEKRFGPGAAHGSTV